MTFGGRTGDSFISLDETLQSTEGPITLTVPVIFYLKEERSLYVRKNVSFVYSHMNESHLQISTNGFISFESPPSRLRISSFSVSPVPVIAPLWADFDFREAGFVYYRVSQDEMLLNQVARKISSRNSEFSDYRPTLCVVVTWSQALLFSTEFLQTTVSSYK